MKAKIEDEVVTETFDGNKDEENYDPSEDESHPIHNLLNQRPKGLSNTPSKNVAQKRKNKIKAQKMARRKQRGK